MSSTTLCGHMSMTYAAPTEIESHVTWQEEFLRALKIRSCAARAAVTIAS
jgi:hypothetical protein